jgi:hypothetical protein
MKSIKGRLTLVSLALLGLVTVAYAQKAEIRGTVQRVDVPSGTVYLTDGRAVRLDPGTRIYAGSREIRLADVQPGWLFVSSAAAAAPGTVIAQPSVPPVAAAAPAPSRIDATGTVASVDPTTGTITLQDGRIVRVTPGTTLWQPVTIGSVAPGASVFVRNAEAVDFRSTSAPANRPFLMGTVSSVDASNSRVVLSDGTVVHMSPGSRVMFNDQPLAVTGLRPGDEVIIGVPAGSTVAPSPTGPAVSALPRQAVGIIEGQYLYVVRRPQAP